MLLRFHKILVNILLFLMAMNIATTPSNPSIAPTYKPSNIPTMKPSTTLPSVKPSSLAPTSKKVSQCSLASYEKWKLVVYTGQLVADPTFWRYQTQPQLVLTNYLALQLAIQECSRQFDSLTLYKSGRMGPVYIQDAYKIMCRSYCLEVDNLIEQAIEASKCSCLQLSTQPSEISYHVKGDMCSANSARILCDKLGYCGIWNCRIDDFMCPRYEWNKKIINFKGPGTCVRGQGLGKGNNASKTTIYTIYIGIIILLITILLS